MRDSHPRVQRTSHCGDTDPYIANPLHARDSNDAGGGWSGSFKQFSARKRNVRKPYALSQALKSRWIRSSVRSMSSRKNVIAAWYI